MLETNEWICKLSYLKAITTAKYSDMDANVKDLDQIMEAQGPEFFALQSDLDQLVSHY
jgi:hypothetical protein